ncbi:MAG: hypothetical protein CHACPFDD_00231 [Phycisphaerae bacterium]|nr:hypothetical protein [Phycisphaerae bacterium]
MFRVDGEIADRMRSDGRVLVIGSDRLASLARRALPSCEIAAEATPLAGVWRLGHESFDGVLMSVAADRASEPIVRSIRELAPDTRLVLSCPPALEPLAREALDCGADEYVLEPLARVEVEQAFGIPVGPLPLAAPSSEHDVLPAIAALLESLGDAAPGEVLQRGAALLMQAFGATGAVLRIEDCAADAGEARATILEERITRDGRTVGVAGLGPRQRGGYSVADATRLASLTRVLAGIFEQRAATRRWREVAWSDELTGLRNRRYLEQRLGELIDDAARRRARLTAFLFDIDDFKTYNDRFGHAAGDDLLRETAELLRRCTRERDLLARYGGDEFAVVFWESEAPRVAGSSHPTDGLILARRLCETIQRHAFRCLGPSAPGPVTISGGLAAFPWDGRTAAELIAAADRVLLDAKRTGKNRVLLAGEDAGEWEEGGMLSP